jgi:hypothetical protein
VQTFDPSTLTPGSVTQADPKLDTNGLQSHGGPTQTVALTAASSAAIGNGVSADYPGTTTPITTDQRGPGFLRQSTPDIGAFELQAPTVTVAKAAQTAPENVAKTISGITVGDPEGSGLTVTLSVSYGTLTVDTTPGVNVTGTGNSITLTGNSGDLNTALATLKYLGNPDYSSPPTDTLNISVSNGASVSGSVTITVETPVQQAADLQATVRALQTAGVLNKGQVKPLIGNLYQQGNPSDIGRIQAFLDEVNALFAASILTPDEAARLLIPGNLLLQSVMAG